MPPLPCHGTDPDIAGHCCWVLSTSVRASLSVTLIISGSNGSKIAGQLLGSVLPKVVLLLLGLNRAEVSIDFRELRALALM